jgi:hypothetical protein
MPARNSAIAPNAAGLQLPARELPHPGGAKTGSTRPMSPGDLLRMSLLRAAVSELDPEHGRDVSTLTRSAPG